MTELKFSVHGIPVPKGSWRHGRGRGRAAGRLVVLPDAAGMRAWCDLVALRARTALQKEHREWSAFRVRTPGVHALEVEVLFVVPRPRSCSCRPYPSVRPDIDKYARGFLDALNGVVWRDDGQVVDLVARKRYAREGLAVGAYARIRDMQAAVAVP